MKLWKCETLEYVFLVSELTTGHLTNAPAAVYHPVWQTVPSAVRLPWPTAVNPLAASAAGCPRPGTSHQRRLAPSAAARQPRPAAVRKQLPNSSRLSAAMSKAANIQSPPRLSVETGNDQYSRATKLVHVSS